MAADTISIIIPAYNEEEMIGKVIDEIKNLDLKCEVIVVDDASEDRTYEEAKSKGVAVIRNPYNKGYGASIKTGIRHAKGDIILLLDADGQHETNDIKSIIANMDGFEMVVGKRSWKEDRFSIRTLGKKLLHGVANYLSGQEIPDLNSGFRAIRKDIAERYLHILPNGYSFTTTITLALLKDAYNIKYVPVSYIKRKGGKSRLRLLRDGLQVLLLIIRIITLFNPLKVFVPASIFLGLAGFIFSIYGVLAGYGIPATGVILVLSGVIIFFYGILADQIALFRRERDV